MNPGGRGDDERVLVEHAVKLLLNSAPPDWAQLHIECTPLGAVSAYAGIPVAPGSQWLAVPAEVKQALNDYLRKAAGTNPIPHQLVVDCFPDGRLSARAEPAPAPAPAPTPVPPWTG